ncbi:helix-turn-helix domain-containing protein [Geobacter sp. SVR]|uniref:helix-turn-helix domain-containing protein n=1 Tax=Geobacter sp. SVR TaxID=2495594 RepID=UPI00143EFB76|nr:helix-turn-helix domain-containing protein [Geobacter sp. SVR]BCS53325.1 hypothetical protein GSVR_16330 [Geobacter sp. SVR]GCF85549.1 hypothetical protein GSbR_21490 [Geobacter sp. SVR]
MSKEQNLQDQILKHLEAVGDITQLIAAKEYGTNDLRDQIYFLRKRLAVEGATKQPSEKRWIKTTFHKSPLKNERYAKYTLMIGTCPAIKRSCVC